MEHANSHGFSPTDHVDKPTEILSNEHRIIERVLSAVEKLAKGPVAALGPWKKALDFFRHFAGLMRGVRKLEAKNIAPEI